MTFAVAVTALLLATSPEAGARRVAVVVGANGAAPGRMELRYAHSDARRMAAALRDVGQFASGDVALLLDPSPEALLQALEDAEAALKAWDGDSLLVFFYSGHADEAAVYPGGARLPMALLRERIERLPAKVRVGIVDACRGGAWTRTKGLREVEPFDLQLPLQLTAEGSVLIASSSGTEDAHESDALGGSFFTHHFITGLRGAADTSSDGEVSLSEAYSYAREQTVRDSSLLAGAAQHPSFDMQLRGRNDLPLSRLRRSHSTLTVRQRRGPLTLVDLESGSVVLQTDEGSRTLQLVLPAGRYLVRRVSPLDIYARSFTVISQASQEVDEGTLEPVRLTRLETKGFQEVAVLRTTLRAREFRFRMGVGYRDLEGPVEPLSGLQHLALPNSVAYGVTDRLQWSVPLPAFQYRFGEREQVEPVVFGGLTGLQLFVPQHDIGVGFQLMAGGGARWWSSADRAVNATLVFTSNMSVGTSGFFAPVTWRLTGSVGVSRAFTPQLAVNFGVSVSENVIRNGRAGNRAPLDESDPTVGVGGVQTLGLGELPLLRFQVTDTFFIDGMASLTYRVRARSVGMTVGFCFLWEV